ncbi:MAG: hypothetical protein JJU45_06850 [Acidimicrobiia bacterium]|nr:hypothetical protein [Acidimicrobiia bacterium]
MPSDEAAASQEQATATTTAEVLTEVSPRGDGTDVDDPNQPALSEEEAVEAAVLEAVQGFWDTVVEANNPPDPTHPGFERYFTGEALEHSRGRTERMLALGHVAQDPDGVELVAPQLEFQSETVVSVLFCFIDNATVVDETTGTVIDDSINVIDAELTVRLDDGKWRVAETSLVTLREGATRCDV